MRHAVTVCTHASRLPSIIINKLMHSDKSIFKRWARQRSALSSCVQALQRAAHAFFSNLHIRHDGIALGAFASFVLDYGEIDRTEAVVRSGRFSTSYTEFVYAYGGTEYNASEKKLFCFFFDGTWCSCSYHRLTIMCVYESLEKWGPRNAGLCVLPLFFAIGIYGCNQSSEPYDRLIER